MIRLISLISLALIFSFTSCGKNDKTTFDSYSTLSSEILLPVLSFEDACKTYNLVCDTDDFQSNISADMWKDATSIMDKFLKGKTQISITRAIYDTGELQSILESLKISHITAPMEALLNTLDWSLITVGLNGSITIHINNPGFEHKFATNLIIRVPGKSFSVRINGDLISLTGLEIAYPDNAPRAFNSIKWVEDEGFLATTAQEEIAGVPLHFLFGHISKVEVPKFDKSDIPLLIDQGRAAIDLAYRTNPTLDVENDLLALISQIIDKHNKTPEIMNVTELLSNITMLKSVPGTRKLEAKLKSGIRYVKCRMVQPGTPVIAMDFRKSFGVQTIKTDVPGELTIELYDVRASVDVYGPIDPGFTLKEITINEEGMTIKNVPVIKQFTLKWDDVTSEDSKVSFTCKKR